MKQGSRPVCTLSEFHRHAAFVCFALLMETSSSCSHPQKPPPNRLSVTVGSASLTGASLNFAPNDPPREWRSQARDYANTRYSPLDQINTDNAGKLRIAWTFSDATVGGHEAAPLVVDNTMYLVTPFPDVLYALDLSKAGEPVKWTFKPNPSPIAKGKACCDTVNRGVAYVDGKLIYNLLDDHTVAVDAKTGKQVWRTKMGNVETGETMTMAPFVVGKKVLVGDSGGELGVWGWVAALDVNSGKELWRAYSTGSDKQVLIGADFKPFYERMKGKDLGVCYLARRHVEARRGLGLGLDFLRPSAESDLLRYQQPLAARTGSAAGR